MPKKEDKEFQIAMCEKLVSFFILFRKSKNLCFYVFKKLKQ